jgi:hypothetical protein
MNRKSLLIAEVKAELRMAKILNKHNKLFMELQNASQTQTNPTEQPVNSTPNQLQGLGNQLPQPTNVP